MKISSKSTSTDVSEPVVEQTLLVSGLIRLADGRVILIDYLLQVVLKDEIERRTKVANLYSTLLTTDQKYLETQEDKRLQKGRDLVDATNMYQTARKVEKACITSAVVIGGAISLINGVTPLSVFSLACGALLTLDTLLDDPVKKQCAKLLSYGDKNMEAVWQERIITATSLLSHGLAFALNGPPFVKIALKVGETAVTVIKTNVERNVNLNKSELVELDYLCDNHYKRKIESRISQFTNERKTIHDITMKLFEFERARSKVISQIFNTQ